MCIRLLSQQTLRVVEALVSFSHFFSLLTMFAWQRPQWPTPKLSHNNCLKTWDTHLCKKHILTLATLHNHVYQVQSFLYKLPLTVWQQFLQELTVVPWRKRLCFFWHQIPTSLIIPAKDFPWCWTELKLETPHSSVLLTAHFRWKVESRGHYFFSQQCQTLPVYIRVYFWLPSFSGSLLPGLL